MTTEHSAEIDAPPRACDYCGKPAPEGPALLSIWWADYECCSMECTVAAEAEARVTPPDVSLFSTPGFVADDELCGARGASYYNPMHVHVCTIVLIGDDQDDDHDSHACYCGDWWHDR